MVLALSASACNPTKVIDYFPGGKTPSENIITKSYYFNDIKGIDASSGIIVHYTQQSAIDSVRIERPDNVIEVLELKLDNDGTLDISLPSSHRFRFKSKEQRPHVWVATPNVIDFDASSGAEINIPAISAEKIEAETSSGAFISFNEVKTDFIDLEASSGAGIKINNIVATRVKADVSSGAGISISGTAKAVSLDASSGGSIKAADLIADKGNASASSGAHISSAIKNVSIDKSSGGSVSNKN